MSRPFGLTTPLATATRALLFSCLCLTSVMAQVSKPTAEDLNQSAPMGAGRTRANQGDYTPPSTDPHDISGTWGISSTPPNQGMGGGGGPGGAPSGMGGANAGGPPPGGSPQTAGGPPPGGSSGLDGNRIQGETSRIQCFPQFATFNGVEGVVDIMQNNRIIIMVSQEMQIVRRIYLNTEHPKTVTPSFEGDSVGHWDGDTLVVDTVGIKNGNNTRHVVERIRKIDNGQTLEAVTTENGRDSTKTVTWNPARKMMEWICEDADEFWDPNYRF